MVALIRSVLLPDDRVALLALDRSLTTDRVYRIARTPRSFVLEEVRVAPAVRKEFPLADDLGPERAWEHGVVAEQDGALVGFAAWTHRRWNRRTELWHLYVAPAWRGQGIGRALIDAAVAAARESAMRCVWLETSNLAYPAIRFYERLGFSLCGLDTSLYDPAELAGAETALYFSRPV
jgi:ribosomal protein S18 acetylase RimI-like enzyme